MTQASPHQSLSTRLSLWIVSLAALVFLAVLSSNYLLSRDLLDYYVEQLAREKAAETTQKVNTVLHGVATSARSLAAVVTVPDISKQHIHEMIKAFVQNNERIYGMTVALEPGALLAPPPRQKTVQDFAPYYYRQNREIRHVDLAGESYDYRNRDWYKAVKDTQKPRWSEPYMDDGGGNVHMVTYSSPVFSRDRRFAGVATADIRLSWLGDIIKQSKISDSGFAFIVSRNDIIIAHPDKSLHMKHFRDTGISHENWKRYLRAKNIAQAQYFSTPCRQQGGHCWVAIKTLADTGWKIILVIPQLSLIHDIRELTMKITALAVFGLVVLFLVVAGISRNQIRPLSKLAQATRNIGAGRLDIELPQTKRRDEIGQLSDDFETMRKALKQYIIDLRETTARQQKLESEIEIAHDIQMSMLPGGGNVSLAGSTYRLFALLRPARSVGGDLYYFHEEGQTLYFMIGDVSDKGVPAALFMAKTVTLYTRALREKLTPGKALTMMNDILAENNDACMFVTALCGQLDLESGRLLMANAGHMDPIIQQDNATQEQAVAGALALGLMADMAYPDVELHLAGNSTLIMYTDGISEAHNRNNEQYGEQRLLALLDNCRTTDATQTGNRIIADVNNFAGIREQFDDITLMIIQRTGDAA